jgi:hypothetical protein
VFAEFFGGALCKVVGAGAGDVEHRKQGNGLAAYRLLDEVGLAQLRDLQMLEDFRARPSMPRLQPARRSAAATRVLVSLAACAGVGAMAKTARASGLARLVADFPAKVSRNAG